MRLSQDIKGHLEYTGSSSNVAGVWLRCKDTDTIFFWQGINGGEGTLPQFCPWCGVPIERETEESKKHYE